MHNGITIIGAGLGGLVLARILQRCGVAVTLYESETGPAGRAQGGLLDIDTENGQAALAKAGLLPAFAHLVRAGEDSKRIIDNQGKILFEKPACPHSSRPEVDRGALRTLLLDSLIPGTVRWAHRLHTVTRSGRHIIAIFENGKAVRAGILVGADGAWSATRAVITSVCPGYTGIAFVEIGLEPGEARKICPDLPACGTVIAIGRDRAILTHCNGDGSLRGYVALRKPESWIQTFRLRSSPYRLSDLICEFDGWVPSLKGLITRSTVKPVLHPLHALPVGHCWPRVAGITLLGDAAHLMSPFSGAGANLAMRDGADLAEALCASPYCQETALKAYETRMFARSAIHAARSASGLDLFFSEDALQDVVTRFERQD